MRKSRLFGTDGIRTKVGNFPLDRDSILKLGNSIDEILGGSKIIFGRDTRDSGKEIEELIVSGILKNAEIYSCGVIPTPGLSYIVDHSDFNYGLMITASHNPYFDNGIKIFGSNGEKIPDELEYRIEDVFFSLNTPEMGNFSYKDIIIKNKEIYENFLLKHIEELKGERLKIVIDCANGATCQIAPRIFKKVGFKILEMNSKPNGRNINYKSGSTNPDYLKNRVITENADIGIAFDGDGDRVIFVDNKGNILNGDHLLFIISKYFQSKGEFKTNNIVVSTIMSNFGLEKALNEYGLKLIRTDVGDRNVYKSMKINNVILGGEQSGHIILRNLQKTGDGILSAIFFLISLCYFNLKPAEIFDQLILYPQITKSIKIKKKRDLSDWNELNEMIAAFKKKYGKDSRILIRYSGTEPKIRIMIESKENSIISENLQKFENLIKSDIGG